jgi:flagellar biosynthetic protein FliQ
VQEVTLTFIPKILAILIVAAFTAPFMGQAIYAFAETVFHRIEVGF